MVLISSCAVEEKTKPIVTDITREFVGEVQQEEAEEKETVEEEGIVPEEVEEEKIVEEDETVPEEIEEAEINESEEEQAEEELPPGTHVVTIKELKLEPQELTIKKGDKVVWKHEDEWEEEGETRHYLAAHNNEFRTPILYYGDTFEHTFSETGIFTYIDIMYGGRDYMRGKIVVE